MRIDMVVVWTICVMAALISSAVVAPTLSADQLASAQRSLTNQHGKRFKLEDLRGKPSVVHFGFTSCAVVCPTMLNGIADYMRKLGERAQRLNFVFVSVDPERDTAATLKEYIGHFDGRIIGVTGSPSGIAALADAFGARYEKRAIEGGGYEVAHVIFAYLLDKSGNKVGTLYMGSESKSDAVMEKLNGLID